MTRRIAMVVLALLLLQGMFWPGLSLVSRRAAVAVSSEDAETGGMQYANWYFGQDNLTQVSVSVQINRDPLTDDGLYFQSYNGYINGHQFYFGLQTRVGKPGYALTGKGLILSEFGTVDSSNTRVAPGGWYEVGTGEGPFISTRLGYAWKASTYILAIKYQETDAIGDWYAFWITDTSANIQTYAGALRFATPSDQSKKGIGDGGGSWTELYYREVQDSLLPEWSISIVEVSAVSRDGNTLHPKTAYLRNADNFYHIDQVFHTESNHLDFLIGGSSTKSFTAKSVTLTPYPAPSIPDTSPPAITVAPSIDGSVVSIASLRLTGKVTDNVGVGQLYVGFNKINIGADGSFTSTIILADGLNSITLIADDLAGNRSTLTIKVTFNHPSDTTPPTLTITSPVGGATVTSSQVTLRGTVTDAGSGLDYLEVNGTRVAVSSGSFSTSITLTAGANTVFVSAWDKAGNKTEKSLTLTYQQGTVLILSIGSTIATKNGGTVYLDTAPVITNGRTLVPLRFIAEAFGIDPLWDGTLRTIKLQRPDRVLTLQINSRISVVEHLDGSGAETVMLDAPPVIMNGRTLVPICFISEQLGATVVWNNATRTVTITWKG